MTHENDPNPNGYPAHWVTKPSDRPTGLDALLGTPTPTNKPDEGIN